MENNVIKFNGAFTLSCQDDEDIMETMEVIRTFIENGYSVDVHPYLDEDSDLVFVKVDLYDEDLKSEPYDEDFHKAADEDILIEDTDGKPDPLLDF